MLVSMKTLMDVANANNFAVPAPNIQNELTARGVIAAAEACQSPLIIDIAFPIHPDIPFLGEQTCRLARESSVPIAINLDHGGSNDREFLPCLHDVMTCIRAGFTSVMVDRSSLPYQQNVEQVHYVVTLAHTLGISVEAELGHVGSGDHYDTHSDMVLTNPDEAVRYIDETGIDCLAVSIGTAHGLYKGTPHLDFDRLASIKAATNHFPLVLHGGSGTGTENLRRACSMGINKVNIGTDLFKAALSAVRTADLEGDKIYSIWDVIIDSWRDELIRWFEPLGCAGKASLYGTVSQAKKKNSVSKFE